MPIALPLLLQFSEGGAMAHSRPDWMWAQALQLLDQAERAHRDLFRPSGTRRRTACWEPPVDVFETDAEVWIQVALPGVAAVWTAADIAIITDSIIECPILMGAPPMGAG